MIFLVLRQAQDEENHPAASRENHIISGLMMISGLMLSLSKHADALTPAYQLETTV